MADEKKSKNMRPRTIRWEMHVDKLAVRLAAERGCTVSELLQQLVQEEAKNPRLEIENPTDGYAKFIRQSQLLADKPAKKTSKSNKK